MADDVLVSSVLAQTEYETEDKLLVTGTLAQTEYDPEIGKMHLSSIFAQVEYDYYLYSSQKTQGLHGSILEVNNKTIRPISLCGSVLLVNNNNKTQCLNGLVELGVYIMPSSLKFEIWNVEKTEKLNELNGTLNLDDATSGSIDFVVKNVNGIETECNLKISKAGLLNDNFVTDNITLSADNGITKVKELTIAAIPEDDFSDTITLFYECNNPGSYLLGSHNYRVKLFGRDLWQDYTNSAYWSSASETTQSPEQAFDTFWSSGYDTILEENVLWLAPSGDWGTDFQPDKVKITYTPAASGDSLIVNLYNITEGATTTIVNHSSYISESELTLTWDTRLDFNRIKLMTEQNNSFTVEKIEFMDDETPPEIIIQETWTAIDISPSNNFDIFTPYNGSEAWNTDRWTITDVGTQFFLRNITDGIELSTAYKITVDSPLTLTSLGVRTFGSGDSYIWTNVVPLDNGDETYSYIIQAYSGVAFDTFNFEFNSSSTTINIISLEQIVIGN